MFIIRNNIQIDLFKVMVNTLRFDNDIEISIIGNSVNGFDIKSSSMNIINSVVDSLPVNRPIRCISIYRDIGYCRCRNWLENCR